VQLASVALKWHPESSKLQDVEKASAEILAADERESVEAEKLKDEKNASDGNKKLEDESNEWTKIRKGDLNKADATDSVTSHLPFMPIE
jgi:hypothetical protein